MTPTELTRYLHRSIPMCIALGVEVVEASATDVVLQAPLGPNVNHQGTLFGGSLATVAITAGFAVMVLALHADGWDHRVVIQRHDYRYLAPGRAAFMAHASIDAGAWRRLSDSLERRDVGRIAIESTVVCEDVTIGTSVGWFVALPRDDDTTAVFAD